MKSEHSEVPLPVLIHPVLHLATNKTNSENRYLVQYSLYSRKKKQQENDGVGGISSLGCAIYLRSSVLASCS